MEVGSVSGQIDSLQMPMEAKNSLATIVETISGEETVQRIILFGSYAYGTATEYSDLDVAVLADCGADAEISTRTYLRKKIGAKVLFPMDFIVLDTQKFNAMYQSRHDLAVDIFERGIPIS